MTVINKRRPLGRQNQAWSRPFRLNKKSWQSKGLVGWWPTLGFISGSVLYDRSGFGANGAITDATWSRDISLGYVMDFTGGSHYTNMGDLAHLESDDWTISVWEKRNVSTDFQTMVNVQYQIAGAGGVCGISIEMASSGNGLRVKVNTSSEETFITDETFATLNVWTFFAATKQGTTILTYADGNLIETDTCASSVMDWTTSTTKRSGIGASWNGSTPAYTNFYKGWLADPRVYNRALTGGEISALYAPQTRWDLYEPIPRVFPVAPLGAADLSVNVSPDANYVQIV